MLESGKAGKWERVVPAEAGTQGDFWIPAFAGMKGLRPHFVRAIRKTENGKRKTENARGESAGYFAAISRMRLLRRLL